LITGVAVEKLAFHPKRAMLENCWKLAGEPGEGWVWPTETKDGHINHDSLKLQHRL
jgi:hypothetical protein